MGAFGCVNNTMKLRSGSYFDIADPQPGQFRVEDIAGALSKICRFGGQIEQWYSVAEHSWHCAKVAIEDGCDDATVRAVLFHDAAEAFIGDIIKPLKIMLPEYREIERKVEFVIADKLGIDLEAYKPIVEEIDHAMLIAERRAMFDSDGVVWTGENEARRVQILFRHWYPLEAEKAFIGMARQCGVNVRG